MTEDPILKIAPQFANGKCRVGRSVAFPTLESIFAQSHDERVNAHTPPKVEEQPVFGNVRRRDIDMRLANRDDSNSGLKGGVSGAMLRNGNRRGLPTAASRHR